MAEHTPGPWIWQHWPDGTDTVAQLSTLGTICTIQPDDVDGEANARLIAAAPELLRACQTFEAWLRREDAGLPVGVVRDTPEGEAQWREWYDENLRLCAEAQTQSRAAIAKATGGSHD